MTEFTGESIITTKHFSVEDHTETYTPTHIYHHYVSSSDSAPKTQFGQGDQTRIVIDKNGEVQAVR